VSYQEEGYTVDDGTGTEHEVQDFLTALVGVVRPRLIVETGCYHGLTTRKLGLAAAAVGEECRIVTCDIDPGLVLMTRERTRGLPVDVRQCRGADLPELREADLVFSDSVYRDRIEEIVLSKHGAMVVVHDTKACLSEGVDLAALIRKWNGLLFDTYRGFGMLRR
jgi:predicted O-methyltransferase YrrM